MSEGFVETGQGPGAGVKAVAMGCDWVQQVSKSNLEGSRDFVAFYRDLTGCVYSILRRRDLAYTVVLRGRSTPPVHVLQTLIVALLQLLTRKKTWMQISQGHLPAPKLQMLSIRCLVLLTSISSDLKPHPRSSQKLFHPGLFRLPGTSEEKKLRERLKTPLNCFLHQAFHFTPKP